MAAYNIWTIDPHIDICNVLAILDFTVKDFLPFGAAQQDTVQTMGDDETFVLPLTDIRIILFSKPHHSEDLYVSIQPIRREN